MPTGELDRVERLLLLHLLEHHGQQVRFEASQWVTEFGIVRQFTAEPADVVRRALRSLEMARFVYRRMQYVVGYSEPKHVYSLTPSGHRKALEVQEEGPAELGGPPPAPSDSRSVVEAARPSRTDEPGGPPEGTEPTV